MIKLRMNGTVILGLSDLNLTRLREGKPIQFSLSELGLDIGGSNQLFILHGETEESICRELGIDPKTGGL